MAAARTLEVCLKSNCVPTVLVENGPWVLEVGVDLAVDVNHNLYWTDIGTGDVSKCSL